MPLPSFHHVRQELRFALSNDNNLSDQDSTQVSQINLIRRRHLRQVIIMGKSNMSPEKLVTNNKLSGESCPREDPENDDTPVGTLGHHSF